MESSYSSRLRPVAFRAPRHRDLSAGMGASVTVPRRRAATLLGVVLAGLIPAWLSPLKVGATPPEPAASPRGAPVEQNATHPPKWPTGPALNPVHPPVYFEQNVGQFDPSLLFIAQLPGYRLDITTTAQILVLDGPSKP